MKGILPLFKWVVSLFSTGIAIYFLGNPIISPTSAWQITEQGDSVWVESQSFVPPLGKVLSPSHGLWYNAEPVHSHLDRSLQFSSLKGPVEVVLDERMVPHIFASNLEDASFVQGFITAKLRLWQMEFQTHAAAGRLTEVFGTTVQVRQRLIQMDKKTRRIGIPLSAERAIEEWKKHPEYAVIQAYSDGINAFIDQLSYKELPLMYKLQDYRPERWTPLKTALLLKSMGRTLTSRSNDFGLTNVFNYLQDSSWFESLYAPYFDEQSPIILDSVKIDRPILVDQSRPIKIFNGYFSEENDQHTASKGLGSNNWAVSGAKTKKGHPILCNDPHLSMNLPALWFEIQIHTPETNTYGVSLPGAPGIISGFNEDIAWGVTNVGHDVQDIYALRWKDSTKKEYWFDGVYRPISYRVEEIQIRGGAPIFDSIPMTHFGPVAYQDTHTDYVLRWILHDPSSEPLTFLKLMHAKDHADYLDALRHFSCPAQNIVFASRSGDIAIRTQGKLPLRKKDQGKFIQEGTSSDQFWPGYIPFEHIPSELNPERGFVGSANQHSIHPDQYPYDYYGYFEDYRGRYLNRRLAEMNDIQIEDMMALQNDAYSLKAEDFISVIKEHLPSGQLSKDALEVWHKFENWDFIYSYDSKEATLFERWFNRFYYSVYDELDASNLPVALQGSPIVYPEDYQLFNILKRDHLNPIFDKVSTEKKESLADLLVDVFETIARQTDTIPIWAVQRNTRVEHLAKVDAFSTKIQSSDGHGSTLNAVKSRPGPSWRMIVELADTVSAYCIFPGGQSENPGSPFSDNMIPNWEAGRYDTAHFMHSFNPDESSRLVYRFNP